MARNAGLVDQRGTQHLLRGLEHFWVGLLDTRNGIYTCSTVHEVNGFWGGSYTWFLLGMYFFPSAG